MIGRRIAVYGPSGSGKTAVGQRLGELLYLPVIELDALFWRPCWEPTPLDEFRAKVLDTLTEHSDGWVCAGNYGTVRDIVLSRAEGVVWLRLPFRVVYWRLLQRTVTRTRRRESLWGTNVESWRRSLLSRDSILLWGISHWWAHHRDTARDLAEVPHQATVHTLRSTREVEEFFASLAPPEVDVVVGEPG